MRYLGKLILLPVYLLLTSCSSVLYHPKSLENVDTDKLIRVERPLYIFYKIDDLEIKTDANVYLKPGKHYFEYVVREVTFPEDITVKTESGATFTFSSTKPINTYRYYRGYFIGKAGESYNSYKLKSKLKGVKKIDEKVRR